MRRLMMLGAVACLSAAPLDSLRVLGDAWPRAFFFRGAEGQAANPKLSYEDWERTFSRLMGIEGKVLEEEVPGRSVRNIDFFTRFKKAHPDQLVLLHYNGNARDPIDQRGKFFDGHWLYYNGAKALEAVPAEAGESDIRVSDPRLFRTGIGRYQNGAEDVALCALKADGKPDWHACEQVKLTSVDAARKVIRVTRGQYGSRPRAFAAGRAVAAAHVYEGPWGEKSHLLWAYNYSTASPRDARGRSCADALIEDLGELFEGKLAAFDGLEFDVLKHALPAGRGGPRGIDSDGDGVADGGVTGGVNAYAFGVVDFLKRLRARLGERRFIMADGWSPNNQRAFGIMNGIEAEGWPSLSDYEIKDWSGGMNRQSFWVANSRPPAFNYINHKFNTAGEKPGVRATPPLPFSTHRLVFAAALLTDSAICYSLAPEPEPGERFGIWDELRKPGWLGRAISPPVRLAKREPGMPGTVARVPGEETRFRITAPAKGPDLVVTFRANAEPARGLPPETGRAMRVGPQDSLAWVNGKEFEYAYYFADVKTEKFEFDVVVEGAEPVSLRDVAAHAYPDAMYREYERGLVLANPGPRPYRFALGRLLPGKSYRRLEGRQDPAVNSGAPVGAEVELGPRDALFLVR